MEIQSSFELITSIASVSISFPIGDTSAMKKVLGSYADILIVSGYTKYIARNKIDKVTASPGNALSGFFKLKIQGHKTKDIIYNASADVMKASLEALPNIGTIDISLSVPSKERALTWTITFLSSPGYFPEMTKNVDTLEALNFLKLQF
jgi:hypothetical protein